jgi:isohexenylglutaconyl-CoA hydratase
LSNELMVERSPLGSGWVEHWTLTGPESRNALTAEMVGALRAACAKAQADKALRGVVLQGAEGHFCAGGSLGVFADFVGRPFSEDKLAGMPDPLISMNREFGSLLEDLCALPQWLLAAVDGVAMGGGVGLLCCADFVLATRAAVFSTPEVTLGIVPAQIAPFMVRRLGQREARRWMLFGQRWSAHEAKDAGLVNAVADGELGIAIQAQVLAFANAAPQAVAATKQLLKTQDEQPLPLLLDQAAQSFAQALRGTEASQGLKAFAGRQPAPWSIG